MARKTLAVQIDTEGRDKGKVYFLTEMPASQGEWWAIRVFLAMARNNVDVPDDIRDQGMAGLAIIGFKALGGMTPHDAKPLLDEMMACVQIIPDPSKPNVIRALIEDDIEEVTTRVRLRREVFTLHTGFSFPDAPSTSGSASGAAAKS